MTAPGWLRRPALWAVVVAVVLASAWVLDPLDAQRVTRAVALAVGVLGLQVVSGYTGQVSLGHGAFMGLGAYTTAVLAADHGWPILAAIPAGGVACLVAGVVVGLPALRIRGLFLALTTLALAAAFPVIVVELDGLTGGFGGKRVPADVVAPAWTGIDATDDHRWRHVLVVVVAVVAFAAVSNLVRSRVGRSLEAVREREVAAAACGIDVARTKVLAFGVGAAVTGVGGGMLILVRPFVSVTDFELILSIQLFTALVIGGAASVPGAVIGGALVVGVPWATEGAGFSASTGIVYGVVLAVLTLALPGGIAGTARRLGLRVSGPAAGPPDGPPGRPPPPPPRGGGLEVEASW